MMAIKGRNTMTNEEALERLKMDRDLCNFNPMTGEEEPMNEDCREMAEALDIAIKFLEQGFCEDAVSREYILDKIHSEDDMEKIENSNLFALHYANLVKNAPSITPTFNKWHLVKDELPNKCSYVNITCRSLIDTRPDWVVETCYVPQYPSSPYSDWGNIPMLNNGECEVIAWMYRNIPEPYKPER